MDKVYFEDFNEGDEFWGHEVVVDLDEMLAYNRQNDPLPIHVDEEAAKSTPYGGVIASGGYTIALMFRSCIGIYNTPECQWQYLGAIEWKVRFAYPVKPGDRLRSKITIRKLTPSSKGGRGIVDQLVEVINQHGDVVMPIEVVAIVAGRPDY